MGIVQKFYRMTRPYLVMRMQTSSSIYSSPPQSNRSGAMPLAHPMHTHTRCVVPLMSEKLKLIVQLSENILEPC